jgi:hypothetical protein
VMGSTGRTRFGPNRDAAASIGMLMTRGSLKKPGFSADC